MSVFRVQGLSWRWLDLKLLVGIVIPPSVFVRHYGVIASESCDSLRIASLCPKKSLDMKALHDVIGTFDRLANQSWGDTPHDQ